jgi:hypothetical protein
MPDTCPTCEQLRADLGAAESILEEAKTILLNLGHEVEGLDIVPALEKAVEKNA